MVPKEKDSPGKETAIFAGIQPTQSQSIITGSCWLINKKTTLEKNMLYTICLNPHLLEENRLPSPMSASMLGGG